MRKMKKITFILACAFFTGLMLPACSNKDKAKNEVENVQESTTTVNPDATIQSEVVSKLNSNGFQSVKVSVNNGEVVLSGELERDNLRKVMQIANEAKPRKVINNLTLK